MPLDVFNRAVEFGDAISADGTLMTFDDFVAGFLVQQLNLQYAQQVTRLFEIGGNRQYYVIGRPTGQSQLQRVVGPRQARQAFLKKFGDACNAHKNTIQLTGSAGCTPQAAGVTRAAGAGTGGVSYRLGNVFMDRFGLDIRADNMIMTESMGFTFVGLFTGDQ